MHVKRTQQSGGGAVVERASTEKFFVGAQKIETKGERPRIMNFQ
jgi:hypothetical protein